jgi:type I restriction enzyme S subunit
MIDGLKPYPRYKDTRLPWLATIPEHWEIRRNGRLFVQRNETGFPDLPILEVSLRTGVRVRNFDTSNRKQVMSDREKYKRARRGDIAYNMMRMWQGAVGAAPVDGLISPAYVVARPLPETVSRYYEYLFRTDAYMNEVNRFSRGIVSDRNRLYWEDFKQMPSPFPPPVEQAMIVGFLDYFDRRIRRYIRAKQRLIDMLNEQKQVIIHRAITRGLNPKIVPKPSGVEWLGDVPDGWTLKRFKFVTRITSGQVDPREPKFRNYILIAPNHIESGSGRITHQETADHQGADSGKYFVQAGQIIYSKIRPNLRKAAIATTDCLCSADMYPIWPRTSELRTEYLLMLLLSAPFTRYAVDCSMRVAMPKINRLALGECWLWYPSLSEQHEILQHLKERMTLPDEAVASARREIELVRDFRVRLVADLVTGKLDVRKAGASLPDEGGSAEPIDESELPASETDEAEFDAVLQEADT